MTGDKQNMSESSHPIKVLHVLGKLGSGGEEKLLVSIMENMDRDVVAFDYLLFIHEEGFYDKYVQELGAKLLYLETKPHKGKLVQKIANNFCLYRFMKNTEYPIVHFHGIQPSTYVHAFLAKKAGVKNVIVHAHNTQSLTRFKTKILPLFKQLFGKYPSYYIACSQEAADNMCPKNLPKEKGCVIINGIDCTAYGFTESKRCAFRAENHLNDKFVVGHIGRFAAVKNHQFLLKVFEKVQAIVPNSVLLLIGEGTMKEQIQEMAVSMGISDKVIFYGTTKDVPSALMGMDVMCFPSIYEGLGIVAIEAQAASLPIVVSDGVPESANISEYYYKLNLSDSVKMWADLICSFYGKKDRKPNLNLKDTEYDIKESAKKMTTVYQSLISQ